MERMEYVFCEFCQSEVLSNDAWERDSQAICEKCWAKLEKRYDVTEEEAADQDFSVVESKDLPPSIRGISPKFRRCSENQSFAIAYFYPRKSRKACRESSESDNISCNGAGQAFLVHFSADRLSITVNSRKPLRVL